MLLLLRYRAGIRQMLHANPCMSAVCSTWKKLVWQLHSIVLQALQCVLFGSLTLCCLGMRVQCIAPAGGCGAVWCTKEPFPLACAGFCIRG